MANEQVKKSSAQNEAVETERLGLEKKLRELRKVITGQTIGAMGTKGPTMGMGVLGIENA